jgi:putative ABC transport system permease protein
VNLLLGAITEGFILAPLALGLYLSYRVHDILDLTADGSFGVGAAAFAALLLRGVDPVTATLLGAMAGVFAGCITGVLHTRLRVNASLAGVLLTTALYSVTLFIMGGGNLSLTSTDSLVTIAARLGQRLFCLPVSLTLLGTSISGESLAGLAVMGVLACALSLGVILFLRTDLGLALRAAGSNPRMARSVAVNVDHMIVLGLGLSNGVIALSGALLAQYQGYAGVQMGIGAVVTGLATLMVGEALVGRRSPGRWVSGALVGAVVFRLLIAGAVRAGLNANALKLVTALLVLVVLLLPRLVPAGRRPLPGHTMAEHA